jgi:hypothetical protein
MNFTIWRTKKMKTRTIYIAGPMTGKPGFNYQKFNAWARSLRALGWGVKNPVEIGERFGTADEINADKPLLETVMAAEIEELKKQIQKLISPESEFVIHDGGVIPSELN